MQLVFVLAALGGLAIGSFLNVLIYRLPRGIGFVSGRSFCPKCKKKIAWYDNVPFLSFVLLGGRCRKCGKKISWRYPAVEFITGGLFCLAAVWWAGGMWSGMETAVNLVLISALVVIFFADLETMIIPDEVVVPVMVVFAIYRLTGLVPITSYRAIVTCLSPAFLSLAFFWLVYRVTKRKGIGLGDVKFAFLIGLVLGYPGGVIAFYLAFLTGAIAGIILVVLGRAKWKKKIAFGPFLCFGVLVSLFWGQAIADWATRVLF